MKFLIERLANKFWLQGDDGQVVELTNLFRFDTTYETDRFSVLPVSSQSVPPTIIHMELRGVELDYVDSINSIPTKKKSSTDIRKRKMR